MWDNLAETRALWEKEYGLPYDLEDLGRYVRDYSCPDSFLLERTYHDESYVDYCQGELRENHGGTVGLDFLEKHILKPMGQPDILDHGCGYGAWAAPLEARGWRVTGMDSNATFLRLSRDRMGFKGPLIEADASQWISPVPFDVVLSLGGTFPCFEPAQISAILNNLFASLRPGGLFFLQMVNPEHILRGGHQRSWHFGAHHQMVAAEWDFQEHPKRWTVTHRRFHPQGQGAWKGTRHQFQVTPYLMDELTSLLARHGFSLKGSWGDYEGGDVAETRRNLMLLFQRD